MTAEWTAWGFPTAQEHVTAAWLSENLNETIDSFEIEKVGTGFTADAHRITYGTDKKTVILKLPSGLGEAKQKSHAADCTVEVMFYRDFAAKLSGLMHLPKVYATNTDPSATHRWNILMEDLGSASLEEFPSVFLFGKAHVPHVVDIIQKTTTQLAQLHAKFWQDQEAFDHPIFTSVQEPLAPGAKVTCGWISLAKKVWAPDFRGTGKTCNLVVTELLEKFGGPDSDVLGCSDVFSTRGKFYEFAKTMHTPLIQDTVEYIIQHFDARPHTLVHGDAHLGNVFVDRANGDITWIDFQFACRGPPAFEMLQAIDNLEPEDKMPALKQYYDQLVKAKPSVAEDYSFDDLYLDYRYISFIFTMALTIGYLPDVVPYVSADAVANPEGMIKGWQLRTERWGVTWDQNKIYDVPAEIAALKAAAAAQTQE